MVSDAQAVDRLARDLDAVDAAKVQRMFDAAPRMLAALIRLNNVAVWDEDTDREEFDAASSEADAIIAELTGVSSVDGARG